MNLQKFESPMLYLLGALVLIEIGALLLLYLLKRPRAEKQEGEARLESVKIIRPVGQHGVLSEISRLRAGGELNDAWVRSLSIEDKAMFEVALIDALTELPREQQHRLRATLVKHGYDEQCARRLMRGDISDRVRASALLELLRPQTQGGSDAQAKPEPPIERVRSAKSGSASSPGNEG